ncbi:hypothetical protein QIA45_04810 (plasmid) [Borreliella andersonii]|uniref:Uncharacterized protein n=1 Tax=Borrelia andersonii TaxID=42109 RepID=A0ABZ3JCZ2_BORAD
MLHVKSVGVMKDQRTCEYTDAIGICKCKRLYDSIMDRNYL